MAEKMNVLWLVNVLFPQVCRHIGNPSPVLGGWMYGYYSAIKTYCPNICLHILSPYSGDDFLKVELDGTVFYAYPENTSVEALSRWLKQVNEEVRPYAVHLHGSEFVHASAFVKTCGPAHVVLSIQGLMSVYARYYWGGIDSKELGRYTTFRDVLKRDTIASQQRAFAARGEKESWLISSVHNIAGRTDWDRENCWALNPEMNYFQCEEALRTSFYEHSWNLSGCKRHSIFLSQVTYPIKGLHKFLEALPLIVRHYPDVEVYMVGDDLSKKPKYRRSTYWNYLSTFLERDEIGSRCHFLSRLSEQEMVQHYLSAHVFVCPSVIENSSNSVCEAQLLGTPVVAANVGGMANLITSHKSGVLYRFEETSMLAHEVCRIFADDDYTQSLSTEERRVAQIRHDKKQIALSLEDIYKTIGGDE